MSSHLMNVLAFVLPTLIGGGACLFSILVGAPAVRELRRKTGDTSLLTYILGLEFLQPKRK